MRYWIWGLLSCGFLTSSIFAGELVSYDHNLYVTRPMMTALRSSEQLVKEKDQDLKYQHLLQKRSLHAQKYTNHDDKPYRLGLEEARNQQIQEHIRRIARDRR